MCSIACQVAVYDTDVGLRLLLQDMQACGVKLDRAVANILIAALGRSGLVQVCAALPLLVLLRIAFLFAKLMAICCM